MNLLTYLAAAGALLLPVGDERGPTTTSSCRAPSLAPIRIEMTPTRRAGGARAVYEMRFAASSFDITISEAGHHLYEVQVAVSGLRPRPGKTFVVWVATSDLSEWMNLGPIAEDGPVEGAVGWNKFIVFVTGETSPDVESWSQEFYFSALSPSARMHTMMGHGPFSSEPCLDLRN